MLVEIVNIKKKQKINVYTDMLLNIHQCNYYYIGIFKDIIGLLLKSIK